MMTLKLKNTNFINIKKNPTSINDIGINKISFLLVNKILNISLVTKILKKLNLYAYFY